MDESPEHRKKKNPDIDSVITAKPLESIDNASGGEATNLKRRRALLAGLAAVPVLLTLKSQSALAQEAAPCSIILSIKLDGGYSQHPNVQVTEADITRCNETSTSTTTTTTTSAPTTP